MTDEKLRKKVRKKCKKLCKFACKHGIHYIDVSAFGTIGISTGYARMRDGGDAVVATVREDEL